MYSTLGSDHLVLTHLSIARHVQNRSVTSIYTYTAKNQLDGHHQSVLEFYLLHGTYPGGHRMQGQ